MGRLGHGLLKAGTLCALIGAGAGCAADQSSASRIELKGDPWVPQATGLSSLNHDANVVVSSAVVSIQDAPLVGMGQGWTGKEVAFTIDLTEDLGDRGSFTLVAETVGFPANLSGGAFPILSYLSDGTNELVNLNRGAGGDCLQSGFYSCSGGYCDTNPNCDINWPSAFFDRDHWEQHQVDFTFHSYASSNTFPTCNWSGGSGRGAANPECPFNTTFFDGSGKLRTGTYTARYVLMTDRYATINGYNAKIKLSLVKKKKSSATAAPTGALDVNLIFVGYTASQASRNEKGKINLDTLVESLDHFLQDPKVNVKLGTVRAIEWVDGESYADLTFSELGPMVRAASSALPPELNGKAVNVFFVSTVTDSSSLLGISGGIGGIPFNGFPGSGVVIPTFNKLDKANPMCSAAPCGITQLDSFFADFELTLAHELGHYLGLNHLSEAQGTEHDKLNDTPICTATNPDYGRITIGSCLFDDLNKFPDPTLGQTCKQVCGSYNSYTGVYCPATLNCEFNYMMYWSSKNFTEGAGTGDGNLFSDQQGRLINYHPLVQ